MYEGFNYRSKFGNWYEIARILAAMGYDLIIASRNYDRLTELKAELKNVNVRVITIDLSREQDAIDLYEHLKDEDIDFLVNNAGFGAYGRFWMFL